MNLELAGKACVVAGASRGIGRAIAIALHREGARVACIARGKDDLDALVRELPGAVAIVGDVVAAADDAIDRSAAALGGIDVVVANVGKSFARNASEMTDDDFAKSLDTNLWSAMRVAQRAVPHLRARGGGSQTPAPPGGAAARSGAEDRSITMISSVWGREAGGAPGYNVAKAGVIALAKALARDYAKDGIRVNSIAPGSILFPGGGWDRRQKADPAGIAAFVARDLPFGRFGTPEEVADVVAFIASPRARWISGACIAVDGVQGRSF